MDQKRADTTCVSNMNLTQQHRHGTVYVWGAPEAKSGCRDAGQTRETTSTPSKYLSCTYTRTHEVRSVLLSTRVYVHQHVPEEGKLFLRQYFRKQVSGVVMGVNVDQSNDLILSSLN